MELGLYVRTLTWLPDGNMEAVPLFRFVYHEHGPMATQWVHPIYPVGVTKGSDYFAWSEARTFLWGDILVSAPLRSEPAPSDSDSVAAGSARL